MPKTPPEPPQYADVCGKVTAQGNAACAFNPAMERGGWGEYMSGGGMDPELNPAPALRCEQEGREKPGNEGNVRAPPRRPVQGVKPAARSKETQR